MLPAVATVWTLEAMQTSNKSTIPTLCALICVLLAPVKRVDAHHSFAAEFRADKTAVVEGVVTEVWFKNPHARYYVDIESDDGEIESWDVRTSSPTLLIRRGWREDTIKVGDRIRIQGFLGHDGRKLLSVIEIELPDGRVLTHGY